MRLWFYRISILITIFWIHSQAQPKYFPLKLTQISLSLYTLYQNGDDFGYIQISPTSLVLELKNILTQTRLVGLVLGAGS